MKKLSKLLNESTWGGMLDRGREDSVSKQDFGAELEIDGTKYIFAKDFWNMGDIYEKENESEWTCFAFNKMPNGSKIITGDTDAAGVFGRDKWDIGENEYEVYVLRNYFDKTKQQLVESSINWGDIDEIGIPEIKNILVKYIEEVYTKHMSDFAYHWIQELESKDWSQDLIICCNIYNEDDIQNGEDSNIDTIQDEFNHNVIEKIHIISFSSLEHTDWDERLEKALTDEYTKIGYVKSEEFDLDPFNDPGNTICLTFVLLGEEKEDDEEDDENHRDY